jgi:hypothetical protein
MDAPETSGERRFVWPADYYASETPAGVVPRWAVFGCGAAALVTFLLIFAAGAFLSSGGMVEFMDMAVGMSVGEMKGMYSSAVSPEQRKELEAEIEAMRAKVREKKIGVPAMQPFLEELRRASADNTITSDEATRLRDAARKASSTVRR